MFWASLGKKIPNFSAISKSVKQQVELINKVDKMVERVMK